MQCAKRLAGFHTSNTISKGFWLHHGLAAEGAHCAQLSYESGLTEESQHCDESVQWGSSSAAQGPSADPHACSPKPGHHSDSSRTELARPISCLRRICQHQGSSAPVALRGLVGPASRKGSYTFASYSSTPGPAPPDPPPLSQSDNSKSLSAGGLQSLVAEANSILQVRLSVDPDHSLCCEVSQITRQPECAYIGTECNASGL